MNGMSRRRIVLGSAAVLLALAVSPAPAQDSEWPPAEDTADEATPPAAGLLMGNIRIAIPAEFSPWLDHGHTKDGYAESPLDVAFGDINGADDGELYAVLYMAGEFLLAGKVDINFASKTGTFTAKYAYLDRSVPTSCWPNHSGPNPSCFTKTTLRSNVLIWDFDGDGANEVAFIGEVETTGHGPKPGISIVGMPAGGTSPWGFSVPAPVIMAQTEGSEIGDRMGLCRVSNTPGPRNFWTHTHDGYYLTVWQLNGAPGSYTIDIVCKKDAHTGNQQRTHEFNAFDVDGDGFDEFMMDGVIDFVDADVAGNPVPTNPDPSYPKSGVQRWSTGYSSGYTEQHMDQMIAADFDPANPGWEIEACETESFTDAHGLYHAGRVDMLWDLAGDGHDATALADNADAPTQNPQSMYIGNWTASRPGLETIFIPKGDGGVYPPDVGPKEETFLIGGYSVDAAQQELTWNGGQFKTQNDTVGFRASGPARILGQIDWDGDYASDEIWNDAWTTIYVWRMGEKGDWGTTPPPGFPTCNQAGSTWSEDGANWSWWWYTRDSSWTCTNGLAGRYSHYFQKLGENGKTGWHVVTAHDVGLDYREEMIAVNPQFLDVYYNTNPLPNPRLHRSPREFASYRQFRTQTVTGPFVYQSLPTMTKLVVTPRTTGVPFSTSGPMKAKAVYSDGVSIDVTSEVSWSSDQPSVVSVSAAGLATSYTTVGSARISATLGNVTSEPGYVYATSSQVPAVLTAGYSNTYLTHGLAAPALKIQARVAQRDNLPLIVSVNNQDGTPWSYPGVPAVVLHDDGDAANGDNLAGDGIYNALIPGAASPSILNLGENVKQIQAALASSPTVKSRAWPYLYKPPVGFPPIYPVFTGNYDNDFQGKTKTPLIAWCGLRGFESSTTAYVEAQVLAPSNPNVSITGCNLVGPNGTTIPMIHQGSLRYVQAVNITGLAAGISLFEVVATGVDNSTGLPVTSDHFPSVRVH